MSKSRCKTVELGPYWSDKGQLLPKEKLKSLIKRLHSLLRLLGMVSIIKQSSWHQEEPRSVPV